MGIKFKWYIRVGTAINPMISNSCNALNTGYNSADKQLLKKEKFVVFILCWVKAMNFQLLCHNHENQAIDSHKYFRFNRFVVYFVLYPIRANKMQ